jgi:hypothetical protein
MGKIFAATIKGDPSSSSQLMDDGVEVLELSADSSATWATDTWDGTGKSPTL